MPMGDLRLIHDALPEPLRAVARMPDPRPLLGEDAKPLSGGRGGSWRVCVESLLCLLKEERRGGMAAKILPDVFVSRGPFLEEWETARFLARESLTPPLFVRWLLPAGPCFRCWTLGRFVEGAVSLSRVWGTGDIGVEALEDAGRFVGGLHRRGVMHGDLNLGNLLLDGAGNLQAIDWRRSVRAADLPPGPRKENLLRLVRSMHKIRRAGGADCPPGFWPPLAEGYAEGYGEREDWAEAFVRRAEEGFPVHALFWR